MASGETSKEDGNKQHSPTVVAYTVPTELQESNTPPVFQPSPWKWVYPEGWENDWYEGELPYLVDANDECIMGTGNCTQYYPTSGWPPDEEERNLIAAAPEMYAAASEVIAAWDFDEIGQIDEELIDRLREALAKARGEHD